MSATQVTEVDFAVPSTGGIGERFDTFAEAVQHARSTITCFTYPGQGQDGEDLVRYSRAFVDLRQREPIQDRPDGMRSGSDGVLLRWEVFLDRIEVSPR